MMSFQKQQGCSKLAILLLSCPALPCNDLDNTKWLLGIHLKKSLLLQKPVPFLEACHVEECAGRSSNYGTDKAKNHKFKRVYAI